jgi:hypothetical protein
VRPAPRGRRGLCRRRGVGDAKRGDDERRRRARRRLERREDVRVMQRIVIRLGQVERVIVVRMVRVALRVVVVMIVIVIRVVVMVVVGVVIVIMIVVVMVRREDEEIVRVLVVAARVRVCDDARTGNGRRGEEGHQDGLDDGWAQAHDAGVLPHSIRVSGRRRMLALHPMPCGMPLALTHLTPGACARPRRSPV